MHTASTFTVLLDRCFNDPDVSGYGWDTSEGYYFSNLTITVFVCHNSCA